MDKAGEQSTCSALDCLDLDGVVELTRELVRAPSTNEPEKGRSEASAVEVVLAWAERFGWSPVVEEVTPGRPNVIVTIESQPGGPTLLFEGHTDVVTEGDYEAWTYDPFGAELIDGRIYGRGSADMKGGVAAFMHAARAIEQQGTFAGTIKLAILCDEEEMMIGVHDFVKRGHADAVDAAIVCEPEGGEVCAVQKGAIRLRVDVTGAMAHGAMPQHGKNPISAMASFMSAVKNLESNLVAEFGTHPLLGDISLTPTHSAAGTLEQLNVIPGKALVTYDIRTVPGLDHEQLLVDIEALATDVENETGTSFSFETLVSRPATDTPVDHPVVVAVADAHRAVSGSEPIFGGVPGTTDGTILWRDAGLPVVVYGPGGKWIAHQVDEFVEVDELQRCAQVYVEAASRFFESAGS